MFYGLCAAPYLTKMILQDRFLHNSKPFPSQFHVLSLYWFRIIIVLLPRILSAPCAISRQVVNRTWITILYPWGKIVPD